MIKIIQQDIEDCTTNFLFIDIQTNIINALRRVMIANLGNHAFNENNIHVGVDAFIIIWSNLKFWRILSFIVSLPIIKQIANLFYKNFAERRFAKLPHCQLSLDR